MKGVLFSFTHASWNDDRTLLRCAYTIETDEETFHLEESLEFPVSVPAIPAIERLEKALHLALGISYYKAFIPPKFVHPYEMTESEAAFWNSVYQNGLGEFLYKNQLPAERLAVFTAQDGEDYNTSNLPLANTALLGLGGGKDSIVAGELLKELGIETTSFVLATGEILGQTQHVADTMGIKLNPVKRKLDLQIIEINKLKGAYNGHIPVSLVFALVGCVLAVSQSHSHVIVANEASASIPHVSWGGQEVNHQWSKSLEFERMFQEYLHENVDENLHYFSAIRPLTSLGVAKVFAHYPDYFNVFTSDNSVFRIKQGERDHPRWSLESPKSLSSYILLAPYMTDEQLLTTFGRNFLNEGILEELFISLLGRSNTPILDCVGTPNELLYSLQQLHQSGRFTDATLMRKAINEGLVGNDKSTVSAEEITLEQAFPKVLTDTLKQKIEEKLA